MFGTNNHRNTTDVTARSIPPVADVRTTWQHIWLWLADSMLTALLLAIVWSFKITDHTHRARQLIVRVYGA